MRCLSFIIIVVICSTLNFAQSPHGDSFDLDCSNCHDELSWEVITDSVKFDHSLTGFELAGQHKLANCSSCHTTMQFKDADADCISCHKDLHQGTVGFDCESCHTPASWIVRDINQVHQLSRFPLVGRHLSADCIQCHYGYNELNFEPLGTNCVDCHLSDFQNASSPNHVQAGFSTECQDCHDISAFEWSATNVVHDFFPLIGGHAIPDCFSCHQQGGSFSGLSSECYACHQQDYETVQDPNHLANQFPTDCKLCHTIMGWEPANFDHNATAFPLTGQHTTLDCSSCHQTGFTGTPTECYACHQDDYEGTTDPNHVAEGFPTDCEQCHTTDGWEPANFDHNLTSFPLTGQHTTLDCSSCHETGFTGTPSECYACHQSDYEGTTDPNHVAEGFPTDCEQCHTTDGWEPANFDHNNTAFPLTGEHISVSCSDCHTSGFAGTPTDCYVCHQDDYEAVTDPNHVANNYSFDCTECHNTNGWEDVNFDHSITQFQLTGAHITTDCSQCHITGFTNTPTDCIGCHEDDFNNSTNPDHNGAGFPPTCEDCHTTTAWTPANFDHDNQYFPIYTGEHAGEWNLCIDCHNVPSNYSVFTCIDCHEHNQVDMDDKHEGVSGYIYASAECFACHPTGEKENAFDHGTSIFPLTGVHTTLNCVDCHQTGYAGTSSDCYVCHDTHYNNSTNPNHQALGLSTECAECHSTDPNWKPALFPQHDQYYQLVGQHSTISQDCSSCHNGNYNNTPAECFGCHEDAYNQAANPDHSGAGIQTTCEDCHDPSAWIPSSFSHTSTGFNLEGEHAAIQCSTCHQGTITGLSQECFSCHEDDYNLAPDHLTQGYPVDCEMCHNSVAWSQVTFDHANTAFPLTGAHINTGCSSCHESGFTGTPTECFACHETNYNQTTNPDHTQLGLSTNCETCHTTEPGWNPALFPNHNNYFELIGAHAQIANNCFDCHNGNYNSTPNICIGCHQTEYNNTTDPPHQALNFADDCLQCHNMNGWLPASFDHTFYPLSNDHISMDCSECHSEPNYQPQCLSCHLDDFLDEHEQGDPTDCWNCHNTFDFDIDGSLEKSDVRFE